MKTAPRTEIPGANLRVGAASCSALDHPPARVVGPRADGPVRQGVRGLIREDLTERVQRALRVVIATVGVLPRGEVTTAAALPSVRERNVEGRALAGDAHPRRVDPLAQLLPGVEVAVVGAQIGRADLPPILDLEDLGRAEDPGLLGIGASGFAALDETREPAAGVDLECEHAVVVVPEQVEQHRNSLQFPVRVNAGLNL